MNEEIKKNEICDDALEIVSGGTVQVADTPVICPKCQSLAVAVFIDGTKECTRCGHTF